MPETPAQKRITLRDVARMKREGQKLVVVTAYDVLFARVVDSAGVDIVLVGDSVGNVVAGFDSTAARQSSST
jgi:3-methyl-2-oxobutanoate hydroxymethyltransferase